jgi:hypothetical protein
MSDDLHMLDEVLVDLKDALRVDWASLERHSSATFGAMGRLRAAYLYHDQTVTASLATYFDRSRDVS